MKATAAYYRATIDTKTLRVVHGPIERRPAPRAPRWDMPSVVAFFSVCLLLATAIASWPVHAARIAPPATNGDTIVIQATLVEP